MKKIAIIGASYLQEPLVVKAKELGLFSICFSWKDGAKCADICDKFYDISIVEKEEILRVCIDERIDGICTIASDIAAPTVAYVANKMGLVGNDYSAAVRAHNKYLMRNAFMQAGVPCPKYVMFDEKNKLIPEILAKVQRLTFPLIIKPSDRSGSLAVTKIIEQSELFPAIMNAQKNSFKHEAMVEEFIEGREISVEVISYNGVHYPLQITDKVTTGAPHFVELEHHQPAELSTEEYTSIYALTIKALDALGITNGASHSEFKITKEGSIVIIEIGGRMGGDFIGSNLVKLSTGYDFVKGVIDLSLGEFTVPIKTLDKHSGVYFLCEETKGLLHVFANLSNYPEIVESAVSDNTLKNVKCSADRSGYFIYQTDNKFIIK